MSSKFDRCIEIVLKHEGGFVDHPADPGGATNFGISLRYARTRGSMFDMDGDGDVDKDDILLVTPEKAKVAYKDWFWRDVRGDELPSGVDLAMVDYAVNSGAGRAIRALQKVLGLQQDGVLGPQTMAAVKLAEPSSVVEGLCAERMAFLQGLSTWPTFGRGWSNRVDDIHAKALEMVGAPIMTYAEAAQTNTAKAASVVAVAGALATAASQAEPAIKALGMLSPWVAVAIIVGAVVGVIFWRKRQA
jgi:lysozyme family protein